MNSHTRFFSFSSRKKELELVPQDGRKDLHNGNNIITEPSSEDPAKPKPLLPNTYSGNRHNTIPKHKIFTEQL